MTQGLTTIETAVISNNSIFLSLFDSTFFLPHLHPPCSFSFFLHHSYPISLLSPTFFKTLISSSVYPVCGNVYDELGQFKMLLNATSECITSFWKDVALSISTHMSPMWLSNVFHATENISSCSLENAGKPLHRISPCRARNR